MTLETSKNLGGVGALLLFISPMLGAVPGIGGFTGIITLVAGILVLIALKGFADYYKDTGIFNNALYAIVIAIVGGVVVAAIAIFAAVDFFLALGLNISDPAAWASLSAIDWQAVTNLDMLLGFAATIFLVWILALVFIVLTAFFLRKSVKLMAARTGVGLFATTGLLLLIGAALTIIFIGIFLVWIATLLLAIAFFSIRPQTSQTPAPPTMQATAPV